jgi:hypothetical protein
MATLHLFVINIRLRELILVQHFYNKCTTALSHGMGPIVCGAHHM